MKNTVSKLQPTLPDTRCLKRLDEEICHVASQVIVYEITRIEKVCGFF